jgi:NAD(P)-dependent dehydrogenase (short-subunit alcohol dehydrogenase family)
MAFPSAAPAPLLTGRTAYVAVSGLGFGPALAAGLEAQGARIAVIDDEAADGFSSGAAVEAAFAAAAARVGAADLVVHAASPASLRRPAALAGMDEADFAQADAATRATLYTLQAAHRQMSGRGGAIVVVGPALSLVGAAHLVALCTACEGQRSLLKSAARQWGKLGITLNWIGVADACYAAELAGLAPEVPELGPPPCALGRTPDLVADVAPVLAFLGSGGARGLTGASINLDGGEWMTP